MRNERTNELYYTEQFVLSTRHMLSRFMPYFANCSLMVDKMVHKSYFKVQNIFTYLMTGSSSVGRVPSLLCLCRTKAPLYSSIGLEPHQTTTAHKLSSLTHIHFQSSICGTIGASDWG